MTKLTKHQIKAPKLRFKEFSGDWQEYKLGNIATFSKGKGISKDEISKDGETECIRYGELYTHYKETIKDIKSKTNIDRANLVFSKINDIIIPGSGETSIDIAKASCILKNGVALGGDLNIIRTLNNGVFLSYYLNSQKRFDIARLSQGISVVHLYSSQLEMLKLLIPQPPEQQKIADFLSSVDEKIKKIKEKNKLLEEYKKGVMQKIFSQEIRFKDESGEEFADWEEKKLGEIFDIKSGNSKTPYINENGKNIIVDMGAIGSNYNLIGNKKTDYSEDLLTTNDLVMAKDDIGGGNIIGKVVLIEENGKYILGDHVYKLTLRNGIIKFLYYSINSYKINKSFRQKANGTAQIGITNGTVLNQFILFPALKEQEIIADFLSSVDKKIEKIRIELEVVEKFKKGLLQSMFV